MVFGSSEVWYKNYSKQHKLLFIWDVFIDFWGCEFIELILLYIE